MPRLPLALMALMMLTALPAPTPAAQQASGGHEWAQLDREFGQILESAAVPGAAWAVVRDGRIVHATGFGVLTRGSTRAVTPETVFRIASVSKTFAALLAGQLVAEGTLRWNDPVRRFVPQFTLARPEHAQRLTLEHLLGQSAGIVPNAYDNLLNAGRTLEQILPQFGRVEPMCPPGQCYTYQNVLFSLVEPAIEASTGRDYAELLRERLFEPLEMQQASVGMAEFLASENRAKPHVKVSRQRWAPTEVNENYYRVAPAAGINASAIDLGQWLIAQMGHRPDVIAPGLVGELTRKRLHTARDMRQKSWRGLLTNAHYGLGWRIYTVGDEDIFMHSGWVRGFVAQVGYSRERGTGIAVLLNAESSALNAMTAHFWKELLAEPPMIVRDEKTTPGSRPGEVAAAATVASGD
ncbi:serine hydrolase domain-containing protein [Wenzhouxiangella sp. EGI_FJ10305]|uniref:serine hydrolase domain-containing protein n=1 Tax=Wenzhouxiangella sp. EGI_FJ10305 TaxID=3243768 RepID=UPI0035E23F4F